MLTHPNLRIKLPKEVEVKSSHPPASVIFETR